MNTKLGPILTQTNVINFMTKIGLRLGMLVNTAPRDREEVKQFKDEDTNVPTKYQLPMSYIF